MTAARTGGGGEQPAPMGWGAHDRHGPRGLASMDLGAIAWWRWSRGKERSGGEEREQLGYRDPSFIPCEHDRNRQIVDGWLGIIGPDRASQIEPITTSDYFFLFSFEISL